MNDVDSGFSAEVAAIGEVLRAMEDLPGPARERVIEYVLKALSIRVGSVPAASTPLRANPDSPTSVTPTPLPASEPPAPGGPSDIRTLKDAKQPTSANQMAAVAAYYLSELAPSGERSDAIDSTDLDRLFRQAGYPLPNRISMTLPNATQAGYFDSTGETGKYRLNPVGYNLVVHGLPSGDGTRRRQSAKRSSRKKAPAKKAPAKKAPTKKA